ncbi:polyprenol monophosphomannose synthase [Candidatus Bathyarchaeota archaeon]|nr:polyprenol monophosphomannose synthase [Candidatus Bathyarchaeota archaeon]
MTKSKTQAAPDVGVISPTYCEAENIGGLIQTIESLNLNSVLLIIDDSSPDETRGIVEKLNEKYGNILLLTRPRKMGLGTAIRDGFELLMSQPNPPKYVITMDADYSHNPYDIPRLLDFAKNGYDLVVGSRYCKGGGVKGWTVLRRITSMVANRMAGSLIHLRMNDFTNGFRCYSQRCVQNVLPKLHSQTYEIQIETIRQAKLHNLKVGEIPITFENRKKGKSKLSLTEIVAFSNYIMKVLLRQK